MPKLREEIDDIIKKALKSDDECRNKKNLGDLGEFMVLLQVSSYDYLNPDLIYMIFREKCAR